MRHRFVNRQNEVDVSLTYSRLFNEILKCLKAIMGYERFFGGVWSPQQQVVNACTVKKHFISYRHLFFLPHLLNDSQTSSLNYHFCPNPSFAWSYSAAIGHWSMSVFGDCEQCWFLYSRYWGNASFNAPKAAPSGGNMLMFSYDVNMRRLKIRLRTTRFNDSESTLYFERIELYTRYTFRFKTCQDVSFT